MNNFISAFYDALLLYAIALNETLTEGLDPRNGQNITSKMWSRTFVGKLVCFFSSLLFVCLLKVRFVKSFIRKGMLFMNIFLI